MKAKEFKERLINKLYSIEIIDDTHGHNTSEPNPTDQWDRASTHTDHNIRGFNVFPNEQYSDISVPYNPEKDTDYYLLYVVYSTGDSFGHDSGNNVEYIGLYTEDELHIAKENERRIEAHDQKKKGNLKLLVPNKNTEFDIFVPWHGYFESLDYIEIESVRRMN